MGDFTKKGIKKGKKKRVFVLSFLQFGSSVGIQKLHHLNQT